MPLLLCCRDTLCAHCACAKINADESSPFIKFVPLIVIPVVNLDYVVFSLPFSLFLPVTLQLPTGTLSFVNQVGNLHFIWKEIPGTDSHLLLGLK